MTGWQMALLGGVLIGFSALLMMALLGRITGISGILSGVLPPYDKTLELPWRLCFLAGLLVGAYFFHQLTGTPLPNPPSGAASTAVVAGILVGFGTRLGGGCTSGHGVCGNARLSPRSMIATVVFCLSGIVTVTVIKNLV